MFMRHRGGAAEPLDPGSAMAAKVNRRRLLRLGGVGATATAVAATAVGQAPAASAAEATVFPRSGRFAFPVGQNQATVSVQGLTSKSIVFAMVQNTTSGMYVQSASRNASTGQITIKLNGPAPGFPYTATVAWFVVELP